MKNPKSLLSAFHVSLQYQKTKLSNLSSDFLAKKRKSTMIWCNHCAQFCRIRTEAGFVTCNSCGKILGEFAKGNKKETDLGMRNISEGRKEVMTSIG